MTRRKTETVFDYVAKDIAMEKVYPIDPLNEKRITQSEIAHRHARFYDYEALKKWKILNQEGKK